MPIYEYRCSKCERTFEIIQKMSDAPLATCESCSGRLEKLFSRTSFHLSGGGWYSSGYAKGSGSGEAGGSSGSGEAGESKPKDSSSTDNSTDKKPKDPGGCGSGCGCH